MNKMKNYRFLQTMLQYRPHIILVFQASGYETGLARRNMNRFLELYFVVPFKMGDIKMGY